MNDFIETVTNMFGLFLIVGMLVFFVVCAYHMFNHDVTVLVDTNYCIEKLNDGDLYRLYQCDYSIKEQRLGFNIVHFETADK